MAFAHLLLLWLSPFLATGARFAHEEAAPFNWKVWEYFQGKPGTDVEPLPQSMSLTDAKASCPTSMHGTLVVGCKNAEGLVSKRGDVNSLCRLRVSDSAVEQKPGWKKGFSGASKTQSVGSDMSSKVVSNNSNPIWNEVEVIVKNKGRVRETTLGRASVPIQDIVSGASTGEQSLDLTDANGKVMLWLQFCAARDVACVENAMKQIGANDASGKVSLNCGESCKPDFLRASQAKVSAVQSQLTAALLASNYEGMYNLVSSRMAGSSARASAPTAGNGSSFAQLDVNPNAVKVVGKAVDAGVKKHNARRAEAAAAITDVQPQPSTKKDSAADKQTAAEVVPAAADAAGGGKPARKETHWAAARTLGEKLPQELEQVAMETCGKAVSRHVAMMMQGRDTKLEEKYSATERSAAVKTMTAIGSALDSIGKQLEEQWWQGHPRPKSGGESVPEDCRLALQA
eukprot:TRINITY_DN6703_c0_g1_i2.p1 TRINITY_DN6703_c0_g1~~TRINITY_DN6703_c0_g1_i2.p1  ORF type:complete len:457 (-),score=88.88 TRINITY_DN6703_c0_g1_i2:142-1512(-)